MQKRKKDIIQFWVWMRNGIAFCTSWLLILMLAYNYIFNIQIILTNTLIKLVLWIIGGVFIFNLFFTPLIIKRWSFTKRLTCFMSVFSLYEGVGFYQFGFFMGKDAAAQWLRFIGIVFVLYLICIAIYNRYSKKQGEIYTQALQEYQQQRSM
ncbi:MAG: hypothetical protein ACLSV2_11425 [Clostridium sp.]